MASLQDTILVVRETAASEAEVAAGDLMNAQILQSGLNFTLDGSGRVLTLTDYSDETSANLRFRIAKGHHSLSTSGVVTIGPEP